MTITTEHLKPENLKETFPLNSTVLCTKKDSFGSYKLLGKVSGYGHNELIIDLLISESLRELNEDRVQVYDEVDLKKCFITKLEKISVHGNKIGEKLPNEDQPLDSSNQVNRKRKSPPSSLLCPEQYNNDVNLLAEDNKRLKNIIEEYKHTVDKNLIERYEYAISQSKQTIERYEQLNILLNQRMKTYEIVLKQTKQKVLNVKVENCNLRLRSIDLHEQNDLFQEQVELTQKENNGLQEKLNQIQEENKVLQERVCQLQEKVDQIGQEIEFV